MPGRVYGLVDPRDGRVRYVGKTRADPKKRLAGHLRGARRGGRTRCATWLRKLDGLGMKPEIIVLEEQPLDLNAAERRWIAHYRKRYTDLLNHLDGGDGGGWEHVNAIRPHGNADALARWRAEHPDAPRGNPEALARWRADHPDEAANALRRVRAAGSKDPVVRSAAAKKAIATRRERSSQNAVQIADNVI